MTGHYIAAPKNNPQAWALKSEQLAFSPFEGHHTGSNIAQVLIRVIDKYNIRTKVRLLSMDVVLALTIGRP